MSVKIQEWQKEMFGRLEREAQIFKFCMYADISYSTLYRLRDGIALKERTVKHIKSKWGGFEAKLNKKAKQEAQQA